MLRQPQTITENIFLGPLMSLYKYLYFNEINETQLLKI